MERQPDNEAQGDAMVHLWVAQRGVEMQFQRVEADLDADDVTGAQADALFFVIALQRVVRAVKLLEDLSSNSATASALQSLRDGFLRQVPEAVNARHAAEHFESWFVGLAPNLSGKKLESGVVARLRDKTKAEMERRAAAGIPEPPSVSGWVAAPQFGRGPQGTEYMFGIELIVNLTTATEAVGRLVGDVMMTFYGRGNVPRGSATRRP